MQAYDSRQPGFQANSQVDNGATPVGQAGFPGEVAGAMMTFMDTGAEFSLGQTALKSVGVAVEASKSDDCQAAIHTAEGFAV